MQLEVGQIVEGKVTGITKYGAFVSLDDKTSGMVHISEIARSYVTDIHEFIKENDVVKMKVLTIGDDGKISLSIKQAMPIAEKPERSERRPKANNIQQPKLDPTCTWAPKKQEPTSFEEMMNRFKQSSDEKFLDLRRKNPESRRTKRGVGVK